MNHLLKLLADNIRAQRRFEVVKNAASDEATVYLYDTIESSDEMAAWFGGVGPQSFIKALNAIDAGTIHIRINSPGGDVFAARAIEQAIREHPANVVAHVDGFAASAASLVAMAADSVEIAPGAFFMIHNAWTVAQGNAADLLDTAALLEKVDGTIAQTYAAKTGMSAEEIADMMAAETWLTGQEAVDAGFADQLAEGAVKDAARWNLSAYKRPPAQAKTEHAAKHEPEPDPTEHLRRRLDLVARLNP